MGLLLGLAGTPLLAWAVLARSGWVEQHALELYCTTNARPVWWQAGGRVAAGLFGLGLFGWLGPRALRWAERRSFADLVRSVLGILIAIGLSLGTTEYALRRSKHWSPPTLAKPAAPIDPFLPPMRVEDNGWYGNEPSSSKAVTTIQGAHIQYFMNSRGDRARGVHDEPDRAAPTILIAGESIGIGYDLPYAKSCAGLIAEDLGVQVVNLSVTGFASDQALARLEQALEWFEHPIATVTFVVPVQLARNVRHETSRLALANGVLETEPPHLSWIERTALGGLFERVSPFHSDEAVPLTRAILQATARVSSAHGAPPLFVMTNYGASCLPSAAGEPILAQALFAGVAGRHAVVDLDREHRISDIDLHPNERGERQLADAIEALVRANP